MSLFSMSSEALSDGHKSPLYDSDIFYANTPVPEESELLTSGPINEDTLNSLDDQESSGTKGKLSKVCFSLSSPLLVFLLVFHAVILCRINVISLLVV